MEWRNKVLIPIILHFRCFCKFCPCKKASLSYRSVLFIFFEGMQIQSFIQDSAFKKKFVLEKLLCHYLNKTRSELRTDGEQEIPAGLEQQIRADYRAYEEDDKPLEYLLGFVEFF